MNATDKNTAPERLTQWSADMDDQMSRQQMAGGWLRALPPVGLQILGGISSHLSAVDRAKLGSVLAVDADGDRWAAPCWPDENAEQVATLDRYAAASGRGPVRTCADLLGLLVHVGVLWEESGQVGPYLPVPGVDEVFPVDEAERAEIAGLRALAARL